MNFLTNKPLPRRTFIQGMGATVALPMLDAMLPLSMRGSWKHAPKDATRLVAIEMVHGAAGCNEIGAKLNLWSPADLGRDFDLGPTALKSLVGSLGTDARSGNRLFRDPGWRWGVTF